MIEPDKEGLAYMRLVRTGGMTFDEMIRELGGDPDLHWEEYAEQLKRLDDLGIVLDSDPRRTTQAGNPVPPQKPSKDSKKPGLSGT
jgi:capsid protein